MRQSRMRQTERWSQLPEQERKTRSFWSFLRKALPGLSWVMVLGAAAIGIYGTGQYAGVFARDAGAPARRQESEARLGAKHGQQRQNDCTLIVPSHPLTAKGLATPYQLSGTIPGSANCDEATASEAAFVQAAVLDPATGQISIYSPLVIDRGAQPAVAPVVPVLPAGAVVGIWFGANGMGLRLKGADFKRARGCEVCQWARLFDLWAGSILQCARVLPGREPAHSCEETRPACFGYGERWNDLPHGARFLRSGPGSKRQRHHLLSHYAGWADGPKYCRECRRVCE